MTDPATEYDANEAAVTILALGSVMCDDMTADEAVVFARRTLVALNLEPWANGKHGGDCTKEPHSCARCHVEEAQATAALMYEHEPLDLARRLAAAEAQNESLRESVERLTRRLDLQEQDLNRSGFALGISATRRESLEHVIETREAERDAAVARANTLAEAAKAALFGIGHGQWCACDICNPLRNAVAALGEARDEQA